MVIQLLRHELQRSTAVAWAYNMATLLAHGLIAGKHEPVQRVVIQTVSHHRVYHEARNRHDLEYGLLRLVYSVKNPREIAPNFRE